MPKYHHLIFLPETCKDFENTEIFTLHNPTNILDKPRIKIFIHDDQVWQLKPHSFSKGSAYNSVEDTAKEKYFYTNEGKPVRSMLLFDEDESKGVTILPQSQYYISLKYDVTYNLIAMFYKKFQIDPIEDTEMDYVRSINDKKVISFKLADDKYQTLRDIHELLIDTMDTNWKLIPSSILETKLRNIAEEIEEGGDKYYKITEPLIQKYLFRKVDLIANDFPESIPIPVDYPEDIQKCNKYVFSCNLLISLLPKPCYQSLMRMDPMIGYYEKYMEYRKSLVEISEERKIVELNVMNIGIANGNGNGKNKVKKTVKKSAVTKKIVAVGRGAIDGFFKMAK